MGFGLSDKREAKGKTWAEGCLDMDRVNVRFERVSGSAKFLRGMDMHPECSGCERTIGRGKEYLHYYDIKMCIDCWPQIGWHLQTLRAQRPSEISAAGVLRETEKVKRRYEEIKGAGTWPARTRRKQ